MQVGILTTNDGPHPHDQWAYVTAKKIVDSFVVIDSSPQKVELEVAKDQARSDIYRIMERHHKALQSKERALLAQGDHARLVSAKNPKEHTDIIEAIEEVCQALQPVLKRCNRVEQVQGDSPVVIQNRMQVNADIEAMVASAVLCDMKTIIDIERGWHADRNPETSHAAEYRRLKTGN